MLSLKKIAITGGISSGKSTVCHLFASRGAYRVSSDTIIHLLYERDSCVEKVVNLLGTFILTRGKIDRKKVARLVFTNREKLTALEGILHPLLMKEISTLHQRVEKQQECPLFVVEMPLVQEIGQEEWFDGIVSVRCEERIARRRLAKRGFPVGSYSERMQRQWPVERKEEQADWILLNNGTYEELNREVAQLFMFLTTD